MRRPFIADYGDRLSDHLQSLERLQTESAVDVTRDFGLWGSMHPLSIGPSATGFVSSPFPIAFALSRCTRIHREFKPV